MESNNINKTIATNPEKLLEERQGVYIGRYNVEGQSVEVKIEVNNEDRQKYRL